MDDIRESGYHDQHKEAAETDHGSSCASLCCVDIEAGNVSSHPAAHGTSNQHTSWRRTLILAFQCIGVIYGDIATSPLYVFSATFPDGIQHKDDIIGVLSLILYTIVLIPFLKYVLLVLKANDNGDGGTFALYSLTCRHANLSLMPIFEHEDNQISCYRLEKPSVNLEMNQNIKDKLEKSKKAKVVVLFLATILGASIAIGDGVLTPCISILSSVNGIKGLGQDAAVYITISVLIVLFSVQRLGTDKVGYMFAPIICIWFLFLIWVGAYNLLKHEPRVLKAFNPLYIVDYFQRNDRDSWISLGGVVLCITGSEAMFSDLGHFNVRAVQISFSGIVLPALLTSYIGQASYLSKFPNHVKNAFYDSIPIPFYWPTLIMANAAAIIASQAVITAAYASVSQSLRLSCFPGVKVIHTSTKHEGQVYIPEINYFLMIACIGVTYGFKSTERIGNTYGIAVVYVMLVTTSLVSLVMLIVWKTRLWQICLFFVAFMSVEFINLASVLYKFSQGGYLPLAFALLLMIIMGTCHYVQQQRYLFEMKNKVSTLLVRQRLNQRH